MDQTTPRNVVEAMQMAERLDAYVEHAKPDGTVDHDHAHHLIRHHSSERPLRSFAKAVSWRIWANLDTLAVVWISISFGDEIAHAIGFASAHGPLGHAAMAVIGETVTKTAHYWIHERLWDRINWGLLPRKED